MLDTCYCCSRLAIMRVTYYPEFRTLAGTCSLCACAQHAQEMIHLTSRAASVQPAPILRITLLTEPGDPEASQPFSVQTDLHLHQ